MAIKLKPCPFCGAEYHIDQNFKGDFWFTADHDKSCFFYDNVFNDGSLCRNDFKRWNRRVSQSVVNQLGDDENCQWIDQEDDKIACWCIEKDRINQIPAADVRPVRKGHYIIGDMGDSSCSECGEKYLDITKRFCPECGAELREG